VPYSLDTIVRIACRHGLTGEPELLPGGGMVNQAWRIGDHILRICVIEEGKDEAAREAALAPLVQGAGVLAPRLVALETESDEFPAPYTIYERAKGTLLGYCPFGPERLKSTYRQIGREIAKIGRIAVPPDVRAILREERGLDPWRGLAKALAGGYVSREHGEEIARWLDATDSAVGVPESQTLIHMDIHPWNVFVDAEADELTAIIDWGDCSWGDPAIEFASMPAAAVPEMLAGYREEGGLADDGFILRALRNGLCAAFWELANLPEREFDRRWWRMPPGGWPEMHASIRKYWPQLAG
jgi:aminoglycoside phosphotransferase (APT) family kinase protein